MSTPTPRGIAQASRPLRPWQGPGNGAGGTTGLWRTTSKNSLTASGTRGCYGRSSITPTVNGGGGPSRDGAQRHCSRRMGAEWSGRQGRHKVVSCVPYWPTSSSSMCLTKGGSGPFRASHGPAMRMTEWCTVARRPRPSTSWRRSVSVSRRVALDCLQRRRGSFPVRLMTDGARTQRRGLTFWGRRCGRDGPKIAPGNSLSPSRQGSATPRRKKGAKPYTTGVCICSRTNRWKTSPGCFIPSCGAGCTTMDACTNLRGTRRSGI